MTMSPSTFTYIRAMVADSSAIVLDDEKQYLVESRLRPVVHRAGLGSIDALVTRLRSTSRTALHAEVVDAMTTNETSFFRDVAPFSLLRDHVIPELLTRRAATRQLNLWSAGCSSGQEVYSLAILLQEHFVDRLRGWDVQIVASDLSSEMIRRARDAQYTTLEIERGPMPEIVAKYLRRDGQQWRVDRRVREAVQFRTFNLAAPWPSLPRMDVILLRNVLVYFDMATKREVLGRVRQLLRPDGTLFLGGAETTRHVDDAFEVATRDGCSVYHLKP